MTNKVRIESADRSTRVFLDDVEQRYISGIQLEFPIGLPPRLRLERLMSEVRIEGEMELEYITVCPSCKTGHQSAPIRGPQERPIRELPGTLRAMLEANAKVNHEANNG